VCPRASSGRPPAGLQSAALHMRCPPNLRDRVAVPIRLVYNLHMLKRLLLVSTLALTCSAQDIVTTLMLNGRYWTNLSGQQRVAYLVGYHDAIIAAQVVDLRPTDEAFKQWAEHFDLTDHLHELDELYRQRENVLLPIPIALRYCVKKLAGQSTKAELEQQLIALRKRYK